MSISKTIATPLFSVLAIFQAVRFFAAWPVTINGFSVPLWVSAIAAIVFAGIAALFWRDNSRSAA